MCYLLKYIYLIFQYLNIPMTYFVILLLSDIFCWYLIPFGVFWCHLMYSDVFWWHLMSSDVIWCHPMSSDVIWCHLMSFHVIWCHLMLSDVIWCHLLSSDTTSWYLMLGAANFKILCGSLTDWLTHKSQTTEICTFCVHSNDSFPSICFVFLYPFLTYFYDINILAKL